MFSAPKDFSPRPLTWADFFCPNDLNFHRAGATPARPRLNPCLPNTHRWRPVEILNESSEHPLNLPTSNFGSLQGNVIGPR